LNWTAEAVINHNQNILYVDEIVNHVVVRNHNQNILYVDRNREPRCLSRTSLQPYCHN
jgi:hypothetical protein